MTITNDQLLMAASAIMQSCPNEYAKSYARVLGQLAVLQAPVEDIRSQVLYVRCNLSHWRGDIARSTKTILDAYVKENRP